MSFQRAKQTYQISGSYLDYVGLIRSLPQEWKTLTRKIRAEYPIIHPQVQVVLNQEKGVKYYNIILQSKTRNCGKYEYMGVKMRDEIWRNKLVGGV